jgi:hypothetical protein
MTPKDTFQASRSALSYIKPTTKTAKTAITCEVTILAMLAVLPPIVLKLRRCARWNTRGGAKAFATNFAPIPIDAGRG